MGALTTTRRRPRTLLALAVPVAVGGAVGTEVRALAEHWWPAAPDGWPWTTFVINLVGSFALGVLLESLVRSSLDAGRQQRYRLLLGTGVLGGFTTYSTFVVEAERRISGGVTLLAVAYLLVSVVAGIAGAGAGVVLADRRRRARSRAAA